MEWANFATQAAGCAPRRLPLGPVRPRPPRGPALRMSWKQNTRNSYTNDYWSKDDETEGSGKWSSKQHWGKRSWSSTAWDWEEEQEETEEVACEVLQFTGQPVDPLKAPKTQEFLF
eukprot:s1883_g3.t3